MQHEKYLYRFVTLFKLDDSDKDGIINEDQFRHLIRAMKIIPPNLADSEENLEREIEKLLVLIDPHKTQQVTFSELVAFLTITEFNEGSSNKDLLPIDNTDQTNSFGEDKNKDLEENNHVNNMSITLLDKVNEAVA